MRIVVDSNILVRAFVSSDGPAHDVVLASLSPGHTLVLSGEMLNEAARVLRYPRLMSIHGGSEETIYNFASWLRSAAEMVVLNPLQHTPIRDRNDIFVLQTVLTGEADVLCTGDRDFFEPPASVFLAGCGIEVLTDVDLLRRLRA